MQPVRQHRRTGTNRHTRVHVPPTQPTRSHNRHVQPLLPKPAYCVPTPSPPAARAQMCTKEARQKQQSLLQEAWTAAPDGRLPAWEQAKAWALREVWRSEKPSEWGMLNYIASKVVKAGEHGGNPSHGALSEFFSKLDADPEWYPGKSTQERFGPPPVMSAQKKQAVARCAMALKRKGVEPTYSRVVALCPKATLNPATNRPVAKKRVYDTFREDCFDSDSEEPWCHKARFSKSALPGWAMDIRAAFANFFLDLGHTDDWFYTWVVWCDICNSVLPRSEKKANEQALARKGRKGWQSPGCEQRSTNRRGNPASLKQNSWGTLRVYWIPVLMRGKLHIETTTAGFPGDVPEGAEILVHKVRAAINIRFQGSPNKPDKLFTDRGPGFYNPGHGKITPEYKAALEATRLTTVIGDDAKAQPGSLGDVLLHETAVSWMRVRLAETTPPRPWLETHDQYNQRLKTCCEAINRDLDVSGLCRGWMKRMQDLKDKAGDRLHH